MSKKDNQDKTIKEQLAELEQIANWFSGDDFDIDLAIDKYRAAQDLLKSITDRLESLKNQITKL